ncbi:hypothetical protein ILUMI_08046 [Ignelater luminosus]|uniref:Uncharacterized protein n=1 Tax=Ignelater luminosus TaxID=2038154 RepID=A0A8K0GDS7_IGNLU|nr:hypothetical protein ILUMI_08046 [Ignelater luminosus]
MRFLIVLVACAIIYSEAKPTNYDVGDLGTSITDCHGISCPSGTVACSKTTKTSSDKKTLLTTIQCEDYNGNVLNSASKSAENPFEDTQISSFSFTGHYNFHRGTNTQTINEPTAYDRNYYNSNNNLDDEVETFA